MLTRKFKIMLLRLKDTPVKLDSAFIMGIEIGLSILMSFQTNFYFLCQVGQMFLNKRDCSRKVFGSDIITQTMYAKKESVVTCARDSICVTCVLCVLLCSS